MVAIMRQHIKADASGLAPAVISHYLFGFEDAADAILSTLRPQPSGETREQVARLASLADDAEAMSLDIAMSNYVGTGASLASDLRAILALIRPAPVASGCQHSSGEGEPFLEVIPDHNVEGCYRTVFMVRPVAKDLPLVNGLSIG